MTYCSHPTCTTTDSDDDQLRFEFIDGDTWIPVCERHVDDRNVHLPLTEDVKNTPVGVLTAVVEVVQDD